MFGLSWVQIGIIVIVGVFVLGPERIPTAVAFVSKGLRQARQMADGAKADLRREVGPELDELRRQVADLQSLAGMAELRDLRELHPRRLIGQGLMGGEPSGDSQGPADAAALATAGRKSAATSPPAKLFASETAACETTPCFQDETLGADVETEVPAGPWALPRALNTVIARFNSDLPLKNWGWPPQPWSSTTNSCCPAGCPPPLRSANSAPRWPGRSALRT